MRGRERWIASRSPCVFLARALPLCVFLFSLSYRTQTLIFNFFMSVALLYCPTVNKHVSLHTAESVVYVWQDTRKKNTGRPKHNPRVVFFTPMLRYAARAAAAAGRRAYSSSAPSHAPPHRWAPLAVAAVAGVAAGTAAMSEPAQKPAPAKPAPPAPVASGPVYTRDQVAQHATPGDVWVTYGDGVYDVSSFIAQHPGGPARLMLAAGGAIDPFWAAYAQHQTPEVRAILEPYRIGTLVSCVCGEGG